MTNFQVPNNLAPVEAGTRSHIHLRIFKTVLWTYFHVAIEFARCGSHCRIRTRGNEQSLRLHKPGNCNAKVNMELTDCRWCPGRYMKTYVTKGHQFHRSPIFIGRLSIIRIRRLRTSYFGMAKVKRAAFANIYAIAVSPRMFKIMN